LKVSLIQCSGGGDKAAQHEVSVRGANASLARGHGAPASMRKAVLACLVGNWLELFDFTIYGYFALQIGRTFFPADDPVASILSTFATYGVGFLMRPIGGMVLGSYGDRRGRKAALALTMGLMAIATGMTGLIPGYAQWGIGAPILLAACRMLQGFSTGGEWGGAATFLVESAPQNRRALYGSLQQLSAGLASLSAVATALLLNAVMSRAALDEWGWRIPFLLGFAVGPVGYYLRMRVEEPASFEQGRRNDPVQRPLREALTAHRAAVLTVLGTVIIWNVAGYIFGTFMASYATQTLKMAATDSLTAVVAGALVHLTTIPLVGLLSDRFASRPFLIAAALGFALLAWPLFHLVSTQRSLASLLIMTMSCGMLSGTFGGAAPSYLCRILPTRIRYVSLSVGYNGAVMIFGGFAPFIATWLVAFTGSAAAPSGYVIACAAISLAVLLAGPIGGR
jgi:MHS family proline/betaine transporter-like MFS transporter